MGAFVVDGFEFDPVNAKLFLAFDADGNILRAAVCCKPDDVLPELARRTFRSCPGVKAVCVVDAKRIDLGNDL